MLADNFNVSLDWLIRGEGPMFMEEVKMYVADPEFENIKPDIRELVVQMENIPLLRFKILSFFHQFKLDHTELFSEG